MRADRLSYEYRYKRLSTIFAEDKESMRNTSLSMDRGNLTFMGDSVRINQNFSASTQNITLMVLTIVSIVVVNLSVLVWVKMKSRALIDKMVVIDCMANISVVGMLLMAFPYRVWNNQYLCLSLSVFRASVVTLNR